MGHAPHNTPSFRVYPIATPAMDRFFLLGNAKDVEVAGVKFKTAPLVPGHVNLLHLTSSQALVNANYTNADDAMSPGRIGLERLYYWYEGERHEATYPWHEARLTQLTPGSTSVGLAKQLMVQCKEKIFLVNVSITLDTQTGEFTFLILRWKDGNGKIFKMPEEIYGMGADFYMERTNSNRGPRRE